MKSYADLARGGNFRVNQSRLATREKVMMVRGSGATGEQQFRHAHQGCHMHGFFLKAPPHGIKRAEPVKELHIGGGSASARQRLAEMMVSVDHPRHGYSVSRADRAVGAEARGRTLSHLLDLTALGINESAAQNGVVRIHRGYRVDITDE
jgi:hypothetical protein